jgi:hypothetical protein
MGLWFREGGTAPKGFPEIRRARRRRLVVTSAAAAAQLRATTGPVVQAEMCFAGRALALQRPYWIRQRPVDRVPGAMTPPGRRASDSVPV